MKRNFLIFLVTLAALVLFAFPIDAAEEKIVILSGDQVINDDYFAFGDKVTISGTVNGDVYAAGSEVIVDGIINGDLIAAGGLVEIRGRVADDVRVGAGEVRIKGEVGDNLTVGSGMLFVDESGRIDGSVLAVSGNSTFLGPIGKSMRVNSGKLTIADNVGGNVYASGETITVKSGSIIQGDFSYVSASSANVEGGAVIRGKQDHKLAEVITDKGDRRGKLFAGLLGFAMTFTSGLVVLSVAPNYSKRISGLISKKIAKSFLIGLASLIFTPILLVLLLVSILGIPFAVLGVFVLIVFLFFGRVFVALALGQFLSGRLKYKSGLIQQFVIGLLLYTILGMIPFFGSVFKITSILVGFGALIWFKKTVFSQLRLKKIL